MFQKYCKQVIFASLLYAVAGCAHVDVAPHLKPISAYTHEHLARLNMTPEAPIFIRIFKEESELEVWKVKDDGRFHLFRSYPICKWSGKLGPKIRQGDKQAPEGFYKVAMNQMNPRSKFYLSFNLGFPNAYDQAHGRTGQHLMVHGDCSSAGCYAMTDALIEEIYLLMRDAFKGGQKHVKVHAFPFRMTPQNMARHKNHKWISFWKTLKVAYDDFELSRKPPRIDVCGHRYVVNAKFKKPHARLQAHLPCPAYEKEDPPIFLGEAGVSVSGAQNRFSFKPGTLSSLPSREIGL